MNLCQAGCDQQLQNWLGRLQIRNIWIAELLFLNRRLLCFIAHSRTPWWCQAGSPGTKTGFMPGTCLLLAALLCPANLCGLHLRVPQLRTVMSPVSCH